MLRWCKGCTATQPLDSLPTSPVARIGRIELGGFRLRRVLGEGAFGTAFLADQLGMDRQAVVKIAHPHLVAGPSGAAIRGRFEAEVRAASRVRHPSLVLLFTAGTTSDGLPALATEFLPGETLGGALEAKLTRPEIQRCFAQIGAGLAALHEAGIVHRDLSPNNVMVSGRGDALQAKIIDFGVARLATRSPSGTHAVGTPRYIAPEQLRGAAEPASDLYALGALLYFALSGKEYLHRLETTDLLLHVAQAKEAPALREVAPNASIDEETLVKSLLSPDPRERPTAAQFLAAWEQIAIPSAPVALLVDDGSPHASAMQRHLDRLGYRVELTSDPRRASRAVAGEYALIAISGALRAVDPIRLTLHIEEHLTEQPVWVMAEHFGLEWNRVKRARCLAFTDLARLPDLASRPPPSERTPRSAATIPVPVDGSGEALIGGGAELIASLVEALASQDRAALAAVSAQLAALAKSAGAHRLGSLAQALGALAGARAGADSLAPLLDELSGAYRESVRNILRGRR